MIVVDFTMVLNLLLSGERLRAVQLCLRRDPAWIAPPFWRPQFCDALVAHVRSGKLPDAKAAQYMLATSLRLVRNSHEAVADDDVLELACSTGLSVHQVTAVLVARRLSTQFVTADDSRVVAAFPDTAVFADSFGTL